MSHSQRQLLSGNEAIALAALHAEVKLGTGYPGTPSTEILENLSALGGPCQWSPNEKVALEVGLGAAYGGARVLVTMKHVGVNVAADPLFTAAYTGVPGGTVIITADDPGMASSQNEQDNRHFARAAGVPMLEAADSQEAYDYTLLGFQISERWHLPVFLRVTTRVCHSKTVVVPTKNIDPAQPTHFEHDPRSLVMIPAFARPAHRELRRKLAEIAKWNDKEGPNRILEGHSRFGVITSGISAMHAREAAPEARQLKLGLTWPLPMQTIRQFAAEVDRCMVIEEGDPMLVESLRADGIHVEGKPEMYRFGELNVARVRRILEGDTTPEAVPPRGKPPQLCNACPHRSVFSVLKEMNCIVAGDIGCYTLSALPPLEAMDTCVCMGASIGVGLGLRHVLPEEQARRVVSVIGDSTFVHSGITGLVEMIYNLPPTGHVVMILDNGTTAMTGLQEHPGTGRAIDHTQAAGQVDYEALARSLGIEDVCTIDAVADQDGLREQLKASLINGKPSVIITRRPCILAAGAIKQYEREAALKVQNGECETCTAALEEKE